MSATSNTLSFGERAGISQVEIRELRTRFDPETFLARAGIGKTVIDLKEKDAVFSQGDLANAVFYVQQGGVKITVVNEDGKEATIALLGAGQFIGEECMTSGRPTRTATATAFTKCAVLKIDKEEMLRVLHREPLFSDLFVSFLLSRNIRFEADLVDQLFNSSEKRLARALLLLAQFGQTDKLETIPNMSHETLAGMVGTTRSRVSFFMRKFRDLGFIDYHGRDVLHIHDSLLNIIQE